MTAVTSRFRPRLRPRFRRMRERTRLPMRGPWRSVAWLLWFALLLPVAQAAALWHGVSHAGSPGAVVGSGDAAKHGVGQAPCDACLAAAAVIGGAAPAARLPVAAVPPRQPAPTLSGVAWLLTAAPAAYRSRAPPLSLH